MLIRPHSDLHMEFYHSMRYNINEVILPLETDSETILVMAGDIGTTRKYDVVEISKLSERFKEVIILLGNHEHYKHNLNMTHFKIRQELEGFNNVRLLDNEIMEIDDIVFIGSTLWTNFNNRDPISMEYAKNTMADFKLITHTSESLRFTPESSIDLFQQNISFIEKQLLKAQNLLKNCIVITHHAPSFKSIAPRFKGNTMNPAFVNDLDDFIEEYTPLLWIHGHIHDHMEYCIGNTTVVANPHGYPGEEREIPHKEKYVLEIDNGVVHTHNF